MGAYRYQLKIVYANVRVKDEKGRRYHTDNITFFVEDLSINLHGT